MLQQLLLPHMSHHHCPSPPPSTTNSKRLSLDLDPFLDEDTLCGSSACLLITQVHCIYEHIGCRVPVAENYDSLATVDSGNCFLWLPRTPPNPPTPPSPWASCRPIRAVAGPSRLTQATGVGRTAGRFWRRSGSWCRTCTGVTSPSRPITGPSTGGCSAKFRSLT